MKRRIDNKDDRKRQGQHKRHKYGQTRQDKSVHTPPAFAHDHRSNNATLSIMRFSKKK